MIRRNLIANFGGKLWTALVSFAFIPIYVDLLGIEGYGLLGVLLSLQGLFALFDLGLSYTLTREFARLLACDSHDKLHDALKSFETCYWAVAGLLALLIVLLSPAIAGWLNYKHLDPTVARHALWVFAFVFALNWPSALYSGGLTGLEKLVPLNVINALSATARNAGGALVLWLASSNILVLLLWYLIVNAVTTSALRVALSANVGPAQQPGRFDFFIIKSTARYSIGVSGILLMLTLLSQLDRVVLSRLVTLDVFGNYMLAVTVTGALGYLAAPVTSALFPRLVRAFIQNDQVGLARTYHLCSQMINVLVIPAAAILFFFAQPVLAAWTGNLDVAQKSAPLMRLLALSTALSLLINCSFLLQAACGWNRLGFFQQLSAVIVMSLLLLALVPSLGALGAAWAWVVLYSAQAMFGPYLMHRRLLRGEYVSWLINDVLVPATVAVLCVWSSAALMPQGMARLTFVTWLLATFCIASLLHLVCSSELRPRLIEYARSGGF